MNNEIADKIEKLKKKQNAIMLVHNYQAPEIQDIADYLGDSLDLSLKAMKTNVKNIIFCGVNFMAESAKILNPKRNVIIPDENAKCPMACMVDYNKLMILKKNPDSKIVSYINTTAKIKSISDICCTSSNCINVVKSIESKKIIFLPDRNLGNYIQRFIKDKELIIWPGMCPTHHKIHKDHLLKIKNKHPDSEIIVHPECRSEIIDLSDHVFSTNGMVNYIKKSNSKEFIIGTEKELCYRLKNENPDKIFYPIETAICPNMKKITLEKVMNSLLTLEPKIKLEKNIIEKAKNPLMKMMDIERGD